MRHSKPAFLALVFALAIGASTSAQPRPDFSGSWRLDLSRSDAAAHSDTSGPITVAIKQSTTELHVTTTTTRGTTDMKYPFVPADAPPLASGPNARWQGDVLLTQAVRDVRGQSVTVQQSRRLAAGGSEMIVESIVNVQHGYSVSGAQTYGVSRDVFVKVLAAK
jgi:hypothetical protein